MKRLLISYILSSSLLFAHTFYEEGGGPWGRDADLTIKKEQKKVMPKSRLQRVCHGSIRFFQNYISDIDGPRSTFYPTSSEYARQMICKYGVLRGIALGCDRLLRENNDPWVYRTVEKYNVLRKIDIQ